MTDAVIPPTVSCFTSGVDTIVAGPEPGCVDATVRGEGERDLFPARGYPLRIVNASEGLAVRVGITSLCEVSPSSEFVVTWLEEHCDRGPSLNDSCAHPTFGTQWFDFDDLSEDSVLEALVAGEGVVLIVSVCGAPP